LPRHRPSNSSLSWEFRHQALVCVDRIDEGANETLTPLANISRRMVPRDESHYTPTFPQKKGYRDFASKAGRMVPK
jgi:hypothetical protein